MDEVESPILPSNLCEVPPRLIAGDHTMFLSMQCRAARALLNWTQLDLAQRAGVSIGTIRGFETDQSSPIPATLAALRAALEKAGVEFIDDDQPGVRMKRWKGKAK
jgi:DNA-binding XRE family transcriptional regulator